MREHWTDDRMDDLAQRVDSGFASVDTRFAELHEDNRQIRREMISLRGELRADNAKLATELRSEMSALGGELRGEIGSLRGEMDGRFKGIERRFDVLIGAIVSGFIGLLISQFVG
jgi:hypothetical protein